MNGVTRSFQHSRLHFQHVRARSVHHVLIVGTGSLTVDKDRNHPGARFHRLGQDLGAFDDE
jgi:hypothetical protein